MEKKRDDIIFNILKIIRTDSVGPSTFYSLLKLSGNILKISEFLPELLKRNKSKVEIISDDLVYKEIEKTYEYGANFLILEDYEYPDSLKNIFNGPPLITLRGNIGLLSKEKLAVVGARNASHNSMMLTKNWVEKLSERYTIVSGMARGIDKFAHATAINYSNSTIAVIAGGINIIYPQENKDLYNQVADKGLIITEDAFDVQPISKFFPKRNRIISALSLGVLVVEAALQSGSLITAKYAAEQGKECFAVPGSPLDPRAKGTNHLIKQGAYLVESPEEIMQILNKDNNKHLNFNDNYSKFCSHNINTLPTEAESLKVQRIILDLVDFTPVSINSILNTHKLDIALFNLAMIELELQGKIERINNDTITRRYNIEE